VPESARRGRSEKRKFLYANWAPNDLKKKAQPITEKVCEVGKKRPVEIKEGRGLLNAAVLGDGRENGAVKRKIRVKAHKELGKKKSLCYAEPKKQA